MARRTLAKLSITNLDFNCKNVREISQNWQYLTISIILPSVSLNLFKPSVSGWCYPSSVLTRWPKMGLSCGPAIFNTWLLGFPGDEFQSTVISRSVVASVEEIGPSCGWIWYLYFLWNKIKLSTFSLAVLGSDPLWPSPWTRCWVTSPAVSLPTRRMRALHRGQCLGVLV